MYPFLRAVACFGGAAAYEYLGEGNCKDKSGKKPPHHRREIDAASGDIFHVQCQVRLQAFQNSICGLRYRWRIRLSACLTVPCRVCAWSCGLQAWCSFWTDCTAYESVDYYGGAGASHVEHVCFFFGLRSTPAGWEPRAGTGGPEVTAVTKADGDADGDNDDSINSHTAHSCHLKSSGQSVTCRRLMLLDGVMRKRAASCGARG